MAARSTNMKTWRFNSDQPAPFGRSRWTERPGFSHICKNGLQQTEENAFNGVQQDAVMKLTVAAQQSRMLRFYLPRFVFVDNL